ncbi:cellulase family glycosylhydrolase [Pseudohalioglobus sediminis]|uniref:Cellulase family glycosylhydrolase n=1 Tax=Pseudohalioglobus sediminis TaxID=2606449 RepID=A0A5B0X2L1_9GAMM|nr:cellulase family glycosylhydrolase [Pseudohalioglobus sediminis]KAA1193442.1 cellulase family glycosylhydrolase [Pseudohalioglobus sediminis]
MNQLEMWQADSFNSDVIERELGWAASFGLNSVRVYLHDLLWEQDGEGFLQRIDTFLTIAAAHGISTVLVFFDDCWHDFARLGPQPAPVPGLHNSRWAMSPGTAALRDRAQWSRLEVYVRSVVKAFANDARVILWDIYNEVCNRFMQNIHAPWYQRLPANARHYLGQILTRGPAERLMIEAFAWARSEAPSQPLTAPVYWNFPRLNQVLVAESDVISFHHYEDATDLERQISDLALHGRPLVCTEWLSRPQSAFATHLPVFRQHGVSSYCWGLVAGKTNTRWGWSNPPGTTTEPEPWFHDLLHADGTPYCAREQELARAEGLNSNSGGDMGAQSRVDN